MARRTPQAQSEHDSIVALSARSYGSTAAANGYGVDTNPNGQKNRSVGPDGNARYPDVIMWKPESPGSTRGIAEVIEEIETGDSVTEAEASQWADYASLNVRVFNLVVPNAKKQAALELIRRKGISGITKVQGYSFYQGSVQFD
jgi:hypothetical protein